MKGRIKSANHRTASFNAVQIGSVRSALKFSELISSGPGQSTFVNRSVPKRTDLIGKAENRTKIKGESEWLCPEWREDKAHLGRNLPLDGISQLLFRLIKIIPLDD